MTKKKKTQQGEKPYGRTEFHSFITPAVLQLLKIIKGVIHHPSCTVDFFFPPGTDEQNTKQRLNILSCQSLLYLA